MRWSAQDGAARLPRRSSAMRRYPNKVSGSGRLTIWQARQTRPRRERSSSATSSLCATRSRVLGPLDRSFLMRDRLSFAATADIDEFIATLEQFERGEISAEAWRKFRLVRGTYGQRQDDVQMLRVKIPQGILAASQLN